jgi:hypothetical protein
VRPEGSCQCKIPLATSRIEPASFRLAAQSLNQLRHRVDLLITRFKYPRKDSETYPVATSYNTRCRGHDTLCMQDDSLGFFRRLPETATGRNMYYDTKLSVRSPQRTVQVYPVESGWLYHAAMCVSVRQLPLGRFRGKFRSPCD